MFETPQQKFVYVQFLFENVEERNRKYYTYNLIKFNEENISIGFFE